MKHNIFINIIIVAIFAAMISGCQKEQPADKKQPVEKRIKAFRDKIELLRENPTLKSGSDPMEIDSAVWYIEATSNHTYGDASFDEDVFKVDSAFIEVPLTNNQILISDVQVAYDQVIDSLSEHNSNITANNKQLIVADISLKENTAISEC